MLHQHPAEVLAVIPVHERPEELRRLLDSLEGLDLTNILFSVLIIEDGTNGEPFTNTEGRITVDTIRNPEPRGPAVCRNRAIAERSADFYWFLDSDTEITDPGVLRYMLDRLEADPSFAGAGGVLEEQDGEWRVQQIDILPNFLFLYRSFPPVSFTGGERAAIGTCNLLVNRAALERVGAFDEALPRDEDNDFCLRATRVGFSFHQDAHTLVRHHCSPAGRASGAFAHFSDPRAYIRDLLRSRNRLLLRHHPWRLPILPLLDIIYVPVVFYRIRRGVYAVKRYQMGLQRHGGGARKFIMLAGLAIQAYAGAWAIAFGRSGGFDAPSIARTIHEK